MDPDEIAKLCDRLHLDIDDTPRVTVVSTESAEGTRKLSQSLVGKIIGGRTPNKEGMESVLRLIWKTKFSFKIEAKGGINTFLFQFSSEEDRNGVLHGGPWLFNKQLISLVKPEGAGAMSSMSFNIVPFWVHILNLPLVCLTEKCVYSVGGLLGEVMAIDLEGLVPRIRVKIDISKPLCRGLRVFLEALNQEFTLPLQYEKLPDFCFSCGMIGHRFCECPANLVRIQEETPKRFGDWLRATNLAPRRKSSKQNSTSASSSHSKQATEPSAAEADSSKELSSSEIQLRNHSQNFISSSPHPGALIFNEMVDVKNSITIANPLSLDATPPIYECPPGPVFKILEPNKMLPTNLGNFDPSVSELNLSDVVVGVEDPHPSGGHRRGRGSSWKRKQSPRRLSLLGPAKGILLKSPPKPKGKSTRGNYMSSKRKLPMSFSKELDCQKKTKTDPKSSSEEMCLSRDKSASPGSQGRRTQ